jgi:hypothetical protein
MSKNKDKGKSKKKTSKAYSGIAAHKRQKKALVPPFMTIPGLKFSSWINDRLPEMLWCALLISHLGRDRALDVFREVAALIPRLPPTKRTVQPTLSWFGSLEPDVCDKFLSTICPDIESKNSLRPLLLFDKLPGREHWAKAIGQSAAQEDWEFVKKAVSIILYRVRRRRLPSKESPEGFQSAPH